MLGDRPQTRRGRLAQQERVFLGDVGEVLDPLAGELRSNVHDALRDRARVDPHALDVVVPFAFGCDFRIFFFGKKI